MRAKITKAAVDALQPGDVLADTEVKGFVARRLPSGVVTYGLRYRVAGRQRWLALGIHGRITPDKARKLAKQRTGEVAADRDPAARASEREREKAMRRQREHGRCAARRVPRAPRPREAAHRQGVRAHLRQVRAAAHWHQVDLQPAAPRHRRDARRHRGRARAGDGGPDAGARAKGFQLVQHARRHLRSPDRAWHGTHQHWRAGPRARVVR